MNRVAELLRQPRVCAALLMVAVALVYWPTALWEWRGFAFVEFDDQQYITDNQVVQQGLTPAGVRWAFTTFAASNWHPLTWMSHMLDCTLFGLRPGWHHAVNVMLHAINTVLVFLVLRNATAHRQDEPGRPSWSHWASLAVAALFGLHPMHVESVAWVSERKDVLSTMFGLLAIGAYVRWVRSGDDRGLNLPSQRTSRQGTRQARRLSGLMLVAALFAASLLAKPMFVTLPFVLLLMDWWPLRRTDHGERWPRLLVEKAPLLALTIGSSIMTVLAQQSKGAMISADAWPLARRLETAANAAASYVWNLAWPSNLSCIYPQPPQWEAWRLPLSFATLAALTVAALLTWRRRAMLVGWLFFLGTLVPVIGLVQVGAQWMADRYTYVPSIGLFIMAAWGTAWITALRAGASWPAWLHRTALALIGVAVVALGAAAHRQVWTWRDTTTLFAHAIAVDRDNYIAHNSLAGELSKQGDDAAAARHVRAAAAIHPGYVDDHDIVGRTLLEQNRLPAARDHFIMLTEQLPRSSRVRNNLGSVLYRSGDLEGARREWEAALELNPSHAGARRNLGTLHMQAGRLDEAAVAFERSLLDEDSAEAHENLGAIRLQQNRTNDAVSHLQQAIRLNPGAVEARVTLGVAMGRLDRLDEAIRYLGEAYQLQPGHPQAGMLLEAARRQKSQSP